MSLAVNEALGFLLFGPESRVICSKKILQWVFPIHRKIPSLAVGAFFVDVFRSNHIKNSVSLASPLPCSISSARTHTHFLSLCLSPSLFLSVPFSNALTTSLSSSTLFLNLGIIFLSSFWLRAKKVNPSANAKIKFSFQPNFWGFWGFCVFWLFLVEGWLLWHEKLKSTATTTTTTTDNLYK